MNPHPTTAVPTRGARRSRRGPVALALLAAIALPGGLASAQAASGGDDTAARLQNARQTLGEWVETRQTLSRERQRWRLGRQLLQERIAVVEREIESLEEKIADAEQSITDADKKRAELVDENERLKDASSALRETVTGFEARVRALLAMLPQPARDLVAPLSQRLPEPSGEPSADASADGDARSRVSLSERYQNVIGILNELDKFNQKVTLTSEVRELPDGSSAEVRTFYVGLGHGYYVGANNDIGGRGAAVDGAWRWTPADDAAPRIADAIAIYENEKTAAFVGLPLALAGAEPIASSASTSDAAASGSSADAETPDAETPDADASPSSTPEAEADQ